MKNIYTLLAVLLITVTAQSQTWQQVATDITPNTSASGEAGVMKVNTDGRPVVAYVSTNDKPTLAVYNPTSMSWDIYENPGFMSSVGDITMDVLNDLAIVGYTNSTSSYQVATVDINTGNWTTLDTWSTAALGYQSTIDISIGSSNPLKAVIAYKNLSGLLEYKEWNSGLNDFVTTGTNYNDIAGAGGVVVGPVKLYQDEDRIFILTKIDYGGFNFPLSMFSKQYGTVSNFSLTSNVEVDPQGANRYDLAGKRNMTSLEPTIHYTLSDFQNFNIVENKKYNYFSNSYTPNLTSYDAFYDVIELSSAGDNNYNYIFFSRDNQPNESMMFARHGGASSWSQVGGVIETELLKD